MVVEWPVSSYYAFQKDAPDNCSFLLGSLSCYFADQAKKKLSWTIWAYFEGLMYWKAAELYACPFNFYVSDSESWAW